MMTVALERLEELVDAEVNHLASVPLVSMSLRDIIDCSEPHQAAMFIQEVVPKRIALRIRMIENVAGWKDVEEIVWMHGKLKQWYTSLRLVQGSNLHEFTACAERVIEEGKEEMTNLIVGTQKLQLRAEHGEDNLDPWLDDHFLSTIATRLLLSHFVALSPWEAGGRGEPFGVVDPNCDAFAICKEVQERVWEESSRGLSSAPPCVLEAYQEGVSGPITNPIKNFSYVPDFLRFVMTELLQNSFQATVDFAADQADLENRPVHVLVTSDPRQIVIRVRDRAGGMSRKAEKRIWSYAQRTPSSIEDSNWLAAKGCGLPLSRLHARYLGGELTLVSFPRYGTDAVLVLPRLSVDMVEKLPGETLL